MMLLSTSGDILESGADVLVNPVNCVGVMGAGLAKQFKEKYPHYFERYKLLCELGEIRWGFVHFYDNFGHGKPNYIVSFPTKQHWNHPSRYQLIRNGLIDLRHKLIHVNRMTNPDLCSVAIPKLGCGHGGLEWTRVRRYIHKVFEDDTEKFDIYLYES